MDNTNDLEQRMIDNNPASGGRKIIAGITDAAIGFGFTFFIGNYVLPNKLWNSWTEGNPAVVLITGYLLYRIITVTTLCATIGMLISKTRFLNKNYEELNLKEKFMAAVFIPYNGIRLFNK